MSQTISLISSGGFRDVPSINDRDLHDECTFKAAVEVQWTPKLGSTSNMHRVPVLSFKQQVVRVTSSELGRSGSFRSSYQQQQRAPAAPLRRSRWSPTPEQLQALEDMYGSRFKTPTAQQIRQLTSQLRHFGEIQCKNVFFWFQNRRARERQKTRRQLMSISQSSHSNDRQEPEPWTKNFLVSDLQNNECERGLKTSSTHKNQWTLSNCCVLADQESSNYSVLKKRMSMASSSSISRQLVEQSYSATATSEAQCSNALAKICDHHRHPYDYNYCMILTPPNIFKGQEIGGTQTLELFPLKSNDLKGVGDTKIQMIRTIDVDTDEESREGVQYFHFL